MPRDNEGDPGALGSNWWKSNPWAWHTTGTSNSAYQDSETERVAKELEEMSELLAKGDLAIKVDGKWWHWEQADSLKFAAYMVRNSKRFLERKRDEDGNSI